MSKGKILVLGSNAAELDIHGGMAKTGQYLNETVVPVWAVREAGFDVVLATPNGRQPHIDEVSRSAAHFAGDEVTFHRAEAFFAEDPSMNHVRTLQSVVDEGLEGYAGFFVPGGQAPVVDLMQNEYVGEILRHAHTHQKPTAMLCHGPIAVIAAMGDAHAFRAALVAGDNATAGKLAKGWQYAGYKMTIFSNTEEVWLEREILHGKMYFHVADALAIAGGDIRTGAADFEPHVIEDRELITGQNPRSDHLLGSKLVQALER